MPPRFITPLSFGRHADVRDYSIAGRHRFRRQLSLKTFILFWVGFAAAMAILWSL